MTEAQMADLSALADGTLDPARRPAVEAWIAASADARALLAREQIVVSRLHAARLEDRAPIGLRARIDASRPSRVKRTRQRVGFGALAAGSLAAVIVVLALVIPSGTPGSPTISEAAALAVRGPTQSVTDPASPSVTQLNVQIQGLHFPSYVGVADAVGQRRDRLGSYTAVTVYYEFHGDRLAYSIFSSPALYWPRVRPVRTGYYALNLNGREVVTWRNGDHTCVISSAHIPVSQLLAFAEHSTI